MDGAGNVFIADPGDDTIKEWSAATQTLSTLVASGLLQPEGVAVDAAGNVYIADWADNAIKEWNAATQTLNTLVASGLYQPQAVAVGGTGNVYIADSGDNAIKEWNAATQQLSTLYAWGFGNWEAVPAVAVDAAGNVYLADSTANRIDELPLAFLPGESFSEVAAAGGDSLAAALPAGESLTGILAPSSDASWLTVGSVSGGVVNFSFTENMGAARTTYIALLGQQVAVTQAAILAATTLVETAAAGSGSDVVSYAGPWTATANASWLHTSPKGSGSGVATFTFDANTGPRRGARSPSPARP